MEKNQILELAIEALEIRKTSIDDEIKQLHLELEKLQKIRPAKTFAAKAKSKRGKSAAERRAQSEKMKKIWAERKAKKEGKKKGVTAKPKAKS